MKEGKEEYKRGGGGRTVFLRLNILALHHFRLVGQYIAWQVCNLNLNYIK